VIIDIWVDTKMIMSGATFYFDLVSAGSPGIYTVTTLHKQVEK